MTDREVIRDILEDVTVDALVTARHADEMADEITAALYARGLMIVHATPDQIARRQPERTNQ